MDDDKEDEMIAQAAAAAAAHTESMHPSRTAGSLLKESSSFRPHMHVQMQALSAHRNVSSSSARLVVLMTAVDVHGCCW